MKTVSVQMTVRYVALTALLVACFSPTAFARKKDKVREEKNGVVIIEAEETESRPGDWEKRTDIKGYSGECYLEFTGNSPLSGPPGSDITFEFKINQSGLYYLKAGETYELEICGRSQLFKLDKIAFFHKDAGSYALGR